MEEGRFDSNQRIASNPETSQQVFATPGTNQHKAFGSPANQQPATGFDKNLHRGNQHQIGQQPLVDSPRFYPVTSIQSRSPTQNRKAAPGSFKPWGIVASPVGERKPVAPDNVSANSRFSSQNSTRPFQMSNPPQVVDLTAPEFDSNQMPELSQGQQVTQGQQVAHGQQLPTGYQLLSDQQFQQMQNTLPLRTADQVSSEHVLNQGYQPGRQVPVPAARQSRATSAPAQDINPLGLAPQTSSDPFDYGMMLSPSTQTGADYDMDSGALDSYIDFDPEAAAHAFFEKDIDVFNELQQTVNDMQRLLNEQANQSNANDFTSQSNQIIQQQTYFTNQSNMEANLPADLPEPTFFIPQERQPQTTQTTYSQQPNHDIASNLFATPTIPPQRPKPAPRPRISVGANSGTSSQNSQNIAGKPDRRRSAPAYANHQTVTAAAGYREQILRTPSTPDSNTASVYSHQSQQTPSTPGSTARGFYQGSQSTLDDYLEEDLNAVSCSFTCSECVGSEFLTFVS